MYTPEKVDRLLDAFRESPVPRRLFIEEDEELDEAIDLERAEPGDQRERVRRASKYAYFTRGTNPEAQERKAAIAKRRVTRCHSWQMNYF